MLGLNPGFYARNVTADTLAGRPLMAVVNQQGQLESGWWLPPMASTAPSNC